MENSNFRDVVCTSHRKETLSTVFENHRKSLIQHCERSELRLHFEWTKKFIQNAKKCLKFGEFLENLELAVKQCYQTGQF